MILRWQADPEARAAYEAPAGQTVTSIVVTIRADAAGRPVSAYKTASSVEVGRPMPTNAARAGRVAIKVEEALRLAPSNPVTDLLKTLYRAKP